MYLKAADGVRVFYDLRGSGAPVVLIHGAAGSGMWFDDLVSVLSETMTCVVMDLRGMSRSEHVPDVSATAWCDDVVALADDLNLKRYHLIGMSLGSRICARVARQDSGRVASLAVDAPLLEAGGGASSTLNKRFENLDSPTQADLAMWTRFHGTDWSSVVRFYARVRNKKDLQSELTARLWLDELTLPTFISRGGVDDNVHPLRHCFEWHAAHPHTSQLWVEPGLGFSLTKFAPRVYAQKYQSFVGLIG